MPSFAGDWLLGALAPAHHVLAKLDRPNYLAMYHSLVESLITRQLMHDQGATVDCAVNDTVAQALSSCLGCNRFRVRRASWVTGWSGRGGLFGDLIPHLESGAYLGAVVGGGHPVPVRPKVWRDAAERGQKSLG